MPKITYSVGKNGMNRKIDTAFIQLLLNSALKDKKWHSLLVCDGVCGPKTVEAIRCFQSRFLKFIHADSLIEPNKMTFAGLVKAVEKNELNKLWNRVVLAYQPVKMVTTGGREKTKKALPEKLTSLPDSKPSPNNAGYLFPLDFVPEHDYHKGGHARYFGARRSNGSRLHAGCDLLAPVGSPVYAIADGVVQGEPDYFYEGTYSVTIKHGSAVVRYGELLAPNAADVRSPILPAIKSSAVVKKGDVIGYVGRLSSGSSMLHFEYYSGSATGKLTDRSSPNLYKRREDLRDPTALLDGAKLNLSKPAERLPQSTVDTAIAIGLSAKKKRGF